MGLEALPERFDEIRDLADSRPRPYVLSFNHKASSQPRAMTIRVPRLTNNAFHCPHCGAYAHQLWVGAVAEDDLRYRRGDGDSSHRHVGGWWFVFCQHCGDHSVWLNDRMIHPDVAGGPPPNPDLPEDIRLDYLEARSIVGRSPRGAAALLRLCIQKLCKHLGEKGKDLNADIASLVNKGLPVDVQQALDSVRVIGNEALHPGQLDLRDDRPTAETLFKLVNLAVQRMISDQKALREVYEGLPKSKLDDIARRDQGA